MASYEIQGRRSSTGVRLRTATSHGAARAAAAEMAADGFIAWIFETTPGPRGRKYRLLDTVTPPAPQPGDHRAAPVGADVPSLRADRHHPPSGLDRRRSPHP